MEKLEERTWKVVHSEYLARKPWFTVRHECVELPNGTRIPDYYIFEYPDWVNIIARTKQGQFVFISQYRHGLGRTDYELVAGCCDPTDATPLDAARRELWEEAGYGGGTWREVMQICANPATQNNLTHCFLATDVERISTQHLEPTEELRVHLLTRDEVRSLLDTNAIPQALMVAPLWRYFATEAKVEK
ncbi:MAG: NUDIX hydrolase [Alistipes sp.]